MESRKVGVLIRLENGDAGDSRVQVRPLYSPLRPLVRLTVSRYAVTVEIRVQIPDLGPTWKVGRVGNASEC